MTQGVRDVRLSFHLNRIPGMQASRSQKAGNWKRTMTVPWKTGRGRAGEKEGVRFVPSDF